MGSLNDEFQKQAEAQNNARKIVTSFFTDLDGQRLPQHLIAAADQANTIGEQEPTYTLDVVPLNVKSVITRVSHYQIRALVMAFGTALPLHLGERDTNVLMALQEVATNGHSLIPTVYSELIQRITQYGEVVVSMGSYTLVTRVDAGNPDDYEGNLP